jgi:phage-related protein
MNNDPPRKPLRWIASSRNDLRKFPKEVRVAVGLALNAAQFGGKYRTAKPLKGFHGAGVLEIVDQDESGTFRAIYTVSFAEVVYVLHVFQKKSRSGIATPKGDIDLIKQRLKLAELEYRKEFLGPSNPI